MKSAPKIITALFLLQFIGLALLFVLPEPSSAADPIKFTPQIDIPNSEFTKDKPYEYSKDGSTLPIAQYIRAIYKYAIGIVGILATVVMMVGGIIWLTAGGNATRVGEAKSWITASLTGLVLALASYLILATVNPALVNLKITKVESVTEMGCCQDTSSTCSSKTKSKCAGTWKGSGYSCSNNLCVDSSGVSGSTGSTCSNVSPIKLCPADQYCGQDYKCYDLSYGSKCSYTSGCQSGLTCIVGMPGNKDGFCMKGQGGDVCCSNSDCSSNKCSRDPAVTCYDSDVTNKKYTCQ